MYSSSNEQLDPHGYRRARSKLCDENKAVVDKAVRRIENGVKIRGGRCGPQTAIEVIGKLGMMLIAQEVSNSIDLRRRSVQLALQLALDPDTEDED